MEYKTEQQLIEELRQEKPNALDYVIVNFSDSLFNVIVKIVKSEEVAHEILQDTFLKVWIKIQTYDKNKGTFFTWILNIARNRAIDIVRSQTFKKQLKSASIDNEDYRQSLSTSSDLNLDFIGLNDLVEKLPIELQELIIFHYNLGYSQSELSNIFNIPLGTIKTRLRSAVIKLRRQLTSELSL